MTEAEMKVARRIARGLALRLNMLKTKLRLAVLKDDVLALALTGQCSADGDQPVDPKIIGQRIVAQLMRSDADKLAGFRNCLKTMIVQAFADAKWLEMPNARDELEAVVAPMADGLMQVADDAVARRRTPIDTWRSMSDAYDAATAGKPAEFAVCTVLAPVSAGRGSSERPEACP